jgi:hypothetical protein
MESGEADRLGNPTLGHRLKRIEELEGELLRKVASLVEADSTLTHADIFILGATKRAVAQSCGFRELLRIRNFPCAAGILRMQLDTAMRINAFTIVEDMDVFARRLFDGEQF